MQDVATPLERMTRSPSELLEAGAIGAGITRAASHVLEHGPAMRRGASRMLDASNKDMRARIQVCDSVLSGVCMSWHTCRRLVTHQCRAIAHVRSCQITGSTLMIDAVRFLVF